MAEDSKILDLNELLGQAKIIKIRKNGIEYELAAMKALSAYQIIQFQTLRQKASRLQLLDQISEEQAKEIENSFEGMLGILCNSLPMNELTYSEKMAIMAFYYTETAQKKVIRPDRKKLIGATSSQS